jgi:hypothetical protein
MEEDMRLFEQALEAHERQLQRNRDTEEEALRREVKEIERWMETMFGVPFEEAFDRDKVEVAVSGREGRGLLIDGHVFVTMTEESLRVTVFEPGFPANLIGEEDFYRGGVAEHDWNLTCLGALLAKAHLAAENRKARAA